VLELADFHATPKQRLGGLWNGVVFMSNSRREFLQTSAALAVGMMGGAGRALAAEPVAGAQTAGSPGQTAEIQVPKMKFGDVEISRLVLGCNPLNGNSHFNASYSSAMREWYTVDRGCAVMHRANAFGINAFNYSNKGRCPEDWERFKAEGGKMYLIAGDSSDDDPVTVARNLKPHALHRQGEVVDVAFRNGTMNTVREWCKRVRDTGVKVGVATHKPEVIALAEEQGWDVDYYAGCVYNRTRSDEEWRKVLNGELLEMPREIYIQSDPARMYKVMRQTPKPCFAFKILAAGRIAGGGIEQAFRTAFSSIKPIDGVFVGMFPRDKDEVKENAEIVHRILTGA
jgi:hypothetical protein